jgi:hypothetical protein
MMNRSPSSRDIVWLSLTLLILITLSFLFSIQPQDYWWCLRIGRDTLATGTVPATETLSWTQAGQPILYEPWLACVIFELTNELGGASLTFLLRGLLIGLTYGLLWFMVRQSLNPALATFLILIVGLASSNNWSMRAQLFAYPLFVFCVYSLLRWHRGSNRWLWGLPVATVLWANLHGSYILSLVLAGSALIFGQGNRRQLFIVLIFMLFGTLMTPHGLDLWTHLPFMLTVQSNQDYSLEWRPPVNEGWQMNIFFAWALLFALLAGGSSRRLSLMEWIWFLGFGWLAFSGVRYVIWFLFLLVVLTARLLAGVIPLRETQPETIKYPIANIALSLLIVALSLLYLPGIRETWWPQAPPAYAADLTPIEAVDWLKDHPELPGPIWNDYAFGSYLSYALPERPVSVDSRFFPFSGEQMEDYVQISRGGSRWKPVFQRDGINLLLLSIKTQPELISMVKASREWCEEYRDETAVIFSRCEPVQ